MPLRSLALILIGLCASMSAALAQTGPATVVLVTNHQDAAIIPLLRSELESLGLTVETVDKGAAEVIPRDLTRAAHDRNAGSRHPASTRRRDSCERT